MEYIYVVFGIYMVCFMVVNDWGEYMYCEEVVLISSGLISFFWSDEIFLFFNLVCDCIWIRFYR